jgi:hypothetical protein
MLCDSRLGVNAVQGPLKPSFAPPLALPRADARPCISDEFGSARGSARISLAAPVRPLPSRPRASAAPRLGARSHT